MELKITDKSQLESIIALLEREVNQAKMLLEASERNRLIFSSSNPFDSEKYKKKIKDYGPILDQLNELYDLFKYIP